MKPPGNPKTAEELWTHWYLKSSGWRASPYFGGVRWWKYVSLYEFSTEDALEIQREQDNAQN